MAGSVQNLNGTDWAGSGQNLNGMDHIKFKQVGAGQSPFKPDVL